MAIANVQHTLGTNAGSPCNVTTGSAITVGNLLIATVSAWNNSTVFTPVITDSRGNTWTLSGDRQNATFGTTRVFYTVVTTAGGTTTVTGTAAGATFMSINVAEFSGVATSSPSDVAAVVGTTATTTSTSANITPVTNGDLVFAALFFTDTGNITGATYTQLDPANDPQITGWFQQATAAAVPVTYTASTATTSVYILNAFKAAATATVVQRMTLLGCGT